MFDRSEVLQQLDAHTCIEHWVYTSKHWLTTRRDYVLLRHRAKLKPAAHNANNSSNNQSSTMQSPLQRFAHSHIHSNTHSHSPHSNNGTTAAQQSSASHSPDESCSYVLVKRSVDHSSCPPQKGIIRADCIVAGWLIEPHWTWALKEPKANSAESLASMTANRQLPHGPELPHVLKLSSKLTTLGIIDLKGLLQTFGSSRLCAQYCNVIGEVRKQIAQQAPLTQAEQRELKQLHEELPEHEV